MVGGTGTRLLRTAARAQAAGAAVLVATGCVSAAAQLALPAVLGKAVDALVGGIGFGRWLAACLGLVIVYVAFEAYSDYRAGVVQARSALFFRRTAANRLVGAGPRARTDGGPGGFAACILESAAAAAMGTNAAVWLALSLLPALVSLFMLWWTDVWIGLVFSCGLPVVAWCLRSFAVDSSLLVTSYLEEQSTVSSRLAEALGGARTIAASQTLEREVARVVEPLPRLRRSGDALWRLQAKVTSQSNVLFPLLHIAVVATAGLQLGRGRISSGQLLAASEYTAMGTGLGMTVLFVNQLARARSGAEQLETYAVLPPMEYGTAELPRPAPSTGLGVELRGVTVRRAGRTVLLGVDIAVPAGGVVALVGRSGSGKSTVAALMGRLFDPDRGAVLLGGVPARTLSRAALRHSVVFAFERPELIGDDIADTIAAGAPNATLDNVARAAGLARAASFIEKMPDGYRTGVESVVLSGGEMQRLGLARAFVRPARLVLLDDATSSLDMATEYEIDRALASGTSGATRVIVAHRASSAARADTVVWLDAGKVRATGTHGELWGLPGYRAIFQERPEPRTPLDAAGAAR
ncbi:ABC transporter ATP-binding protein [Streptomyces hygroscopicus subsp. sporocinereus]|uniref:ABC transporter ATP-binding protein n=1 Tax=Streptomyces hygroscopicus TaxID=1912 RepID=A0ABQ3U6F0_STRHY|nr:ABC transporter ATP-binding protein [Streptomyces hygroscopicus]